MKEIRRITSELKPALTDANQRARLEYALMHLERCSITSLGGINPTFRADMDVVHIDEKWFYRTRKTQNMYLSHREEAPHRECKHRGGRAGGLGSRSVCRRVAPGGGAGGAQPASGLGRGRPEAQSQGVGGGEAAGGEARGEPQGQGPGGRYVPTGSEGSPGGRSG